MLRRLVVGGKIAFSHASGNSFWLAPSLASFRGKTFNRFVSQNRPSICPGCGSRVTNDPSKPGFVKISAPDAMEINAKKQAEKETFDRALASLGDDVRHQLTHEMDGSNKPRKIRVKKDSRLCTRCHSLQYHSRIPDSIDEEKASSFDVYSILRKDPDAMVINVIDIMDFPSSLLDLRKHIGTRPRIIHVFNRVDILCKNPIASQELRTRLRSMLASAQETEEKLDVRVASAIKGWEIDALANSLRRRRRGTNIYFVGSANAGKSTLISTLGRRGRTQELQAPTTSHVPGTTLASIPTRIELFGEALGGGRGDVVDLPGILKDGFSRVIKPDMLREALPHKHIKGHPTSLAQGETLLLADLIQIDYISGTDKHILITPYTHLKPHITTRPDHILSKATTVRTDDSPAFEAALEMDVQAKSGGQNVVDIVFKDIGFVSIALWSGSSKIIIRTPGGLYTSIRSIPLIENSYEH